jgi:hypothetical protein
MIPARLTDQAPVPPPSYQRRAQRVGPRLYLPALCRLAMRLAGIEKRPAKYREAHHVD